MVVIDRKERLRDRIRLNLVGVFSMAERQCGCDGPAGQHAKSPEEDDAGGLKGAPDRRWRKQSSLVHCPNFAS